MPAVRTQKGQGAPDAGSCLFALSTRFGLADHWRIRRIANDHLSDLVADVLPIMDEVAGILSGHNLGSLALNDRDYLEGARATDTRLRHRDPLEGSQYAIEFVRDCPFDPLCPLDLTNAASHGVPSDLVNDMSGPSMALHPPARRIARNV